MLVEGLRPAGQGVPILLIGSTRHRVDHIHHPGTAVHIGQGEGPRCLGGIVIGLILRRQLKAQGQGIHLDGLPYDHSGSVLGFIPQGGNDQILSIG